MVTLCSCTVKSVPQTFPLTRSHTHSTMQFFGRNPSGGQSLASPSSKQPFPVAGSPSNDDPASIMSTFSKPFKFHPWKRGRTDTTGAIAASSSNNNGPLLQPNESPEASSPSLATPNTQTTTTKDPPDNNNVASGNKTDNATVILGIVQTICEVLDNVPYVKAVAGVAITAIKIINVCPRLVVPSLY